MKSLLVGLALLGFFASANAAFTRDAGNNYATDDVLNLDWLALSETSGLSYSDASSSFSEYRLASNSEVDAMFSTIFTGYTNENSFGYSGSYQGITAEVDAFQDYFGYSYPNYTTYSYAFYMDETNTWRTRGTYQDTNTTYVYGNYHGDYSYFATTGIAGFSFFMVRNTATVNATEASSMHLLAFGLLGLFGAARRKV